MTTRVCPPTEKHLRVSDTLYTYDELIAVASATYRKARGDPLTASDERLTEAFRDSIPDADYYACLYAVWHWHGWIPAAVGDLRALLDWMTSFPGGTTRDLVGLNGPWLSSLADQAGAAIDAVMRGEGALASPAKLLLELMTEMDRAVAEFRSSDYAGPTIHSGPDGYDTVEMLRELREWYSYFASYLRSGPRTDGSYFPNPIVYGRLAGSDPLRWEPEVAVG